MILFIFLVHVYYQFILNFEQINLVQDSRI